MTEAKERKRVNIRKFVIFVLILSGFLAIEFPGIIIAGDRIYPFILGMPFLYGYIFCCWLYMCLVFFYAYRTSWGKQSFFNKKIHEKG